MKNIDTEKLAFMVIVFTVCYVVIDVVTSMVKMPTTAENSGIRDEVIGLVAALIAIVTYRMGKDSNKKE